MRAGLLKWFGDWMNQHGYDWFELQMESHRYGPPTGLEPHALAWHTVRLIGDLNVSNLGPFLYEVSADIELKTAVVPVP